MVNDKNIITGFLDAGGARFAAREWDLAFIKMDLCNNKEEFEFFKKEYLKHNQINEELLESLTTVVEIDDIAFQLQTNIKLPITFESNFKDIIEEIQKTM